MSWILLQAEAEATKIVDISAVNKILEVYYCKILDHSARSWTTNTMYVSKCDIRLQANGKHVRSCYKRGMQSCKDSEREQLACKWLKWERSNGKAKTIQECQTTLRKLFSYKSLEAQVQLEHPVANHHRGSAKP